MVARWWPRALTVACALRWTVASSPESSASLDGDHGTNSSAGCLGAVTDPLFLLAATKTRECAGVLIAPDAALTTASCAQQFTDARTAVVSDFHCRPEGEDSVPEVLKVRSVTIDGSSTWAVVALETVVPPRFVVKLDNATDDVKRSSVDTFVSWKGGMTKARNSTVEECDRFGVRDLGRCVHAQGLPMPEVCDDVFTAWITRKTKQEIVKVVGVDMRTTRTCAPASGDLQATIQLVADADEWLNGVVKNPHTAQPSDNHTTEVPFKPSPAVTLALTPTPDIRTNSSAADSSMANRPTPSPATVHIPVGNTTTDDLANKTTPLTLPPVPTPIPTTVAVQIPNWYPVVRNGFAVLQSAQAPSFNALGVLVSPRFVVTLEASLGSEEVTHVKLLEGIIRVKKLWFQRDSLSPQQAQRPDLLVAFELEHAAKAMPMPIVAALPEYNVMAPVNIDAFRDLAGDVPERMYTPATITYRRDIHQCGWNTASEMLCMEVTFEGSVKNTSVNFGVMRNGGSQIMGLALPSVMGWKTSNMTFVHLDSPSSRKFLDEVTNSTTVRDEKEYFARTLLKQMLPAIAEFETPMGPATCGGMLIARQTVLTTASCALHAPIVKVIIRGTPNTRDQKEEYDVAPSDIAIHPAFNKLSIDPAINVAVIHLSKHSDYFADARLLDVDFDPSTFKALYAIDIPSRTVTIINTTQSAAACGLDVPPYAATDLFCATIDSTAGCAASDSTTVLVGKPISGPARIIALGVATAENCNVHVFASMVSAFNMINANSVGQLWGSSLYGYGIRVGSKSGSGSRQPPTKPYVVGLRATKDGQNFCGGTLIAPAYVLTAAHCVVDGMANWVSIGSAKSSGDSNEALRVLTRHVHPAYKKPHMFSNDVAILELSISSYSPAVSLDNTPDFDDNEPSTMYGYGVESTNPDHPSHAIKDISLPMLSRKTCAKTLPDVDDSVLCAGGVADEDACKGDSGSPLVHTVNGVDYLAGVVSAGYGCGEVGIPGIYMRVAELEKFINANVVTPTWRYPKQSPSRAVPAPSRLASPSPVTDHSSTRSGSQLAHPLPTASSEPASPPPTVASRSASPPPTVSSESGSPPPTVSSGSPHVAHGGRPDNRGSPLLPTIPSVRGAVNSSDDHNAGSGAGLTLTTILPGSLPPSTQNALMGFLVGDFAAPRASGAVATASDVGRAIRNPQNTVVLYSTGDLAPINAILANYSNSPLSQRTDRFGTVAATASMAEVPKRVAWSSTSC